MGQNPKAVPCGERPFGGLRTRFARDSDPIGEVVTVQREIGHKGPRWYKGLAGEGLLPGPETRLDNSRYNDYCS